MPASPSPFNAFTLASIAGFALPALAAARARCSLLRDPAGQVAAVWLFFVPYRLLSSALIVLRERQANEWLNAAGILLLPALLAAPLLAWMGPGARRRQPLVLAAMAALWVLGLLATGGPGRAFVAVASPVEVIAVAALGLGALMARVRQHIVTANPAPLRRMPWFWVCWGIIAYALVTVAYRPLLEVLMTLDWDAMLRAFYALQLAAALPMLPIAYGVLLTRRTAAPAARPPRVGPAPSRGLGPAGAA